MRMSWKLGRFAGIDLYLNPTFLFVLAYGAMQAGTLGMFLVLSAFACVVLHEYGHALMARRYGIETKDITLYMIGGVARLTRMPRSPGAELAIALAGPAVNVVIASILGLASALGLFEVLGGEFSMLGFFAFNLLWINVILAAFNLIPAFPMDGGRVLRALLSGWLGRARATMIAASLGRGLALFFGAYQLLQWNWPAVLLAAFVYLAAGSELARVIAEERSHDDDSDGLWTAPPGFRWVSRGRGVWQLAPITVPVADWNARRWR
jgi:Zn-dependent protease